MRRVARLFPSYALTNSQATGKGLVIGEPSLYGFIYLQGADKTEEILKHLITQAEERDVEVFFRVLMKREFPKQPVHRDLVRAYDSNRGVLTVANTRTGCLM